jgi:hypothetical protein
LAILPSAETDKHLSYLNGGTIRNGDARARRWEECETRAGENLGLRAEPAVVPARRQRVRVDQEVCIVLTIREVIDDDDRRPSTAKNRFPLGVQRIMIDDDRDRTDFVGDGLSFEGILMASSSRP